MREREWEGFRKDLGRVGIGGEGRGGEGSEEGSKVMILPKAEVHVSNVNTVTRMQIWKGSKECKECKDCKGYEADRRETGAGKTGECKDLLTKTKAAVLC